jgi:hypothetical protein
VILLVLEHLRYAILLNYSDILNLKHNLVKNGGKRELLVFLMVILD